MEDLALLFHLLKGDKDLDSPCSLTLEAKAAIEKVQEALSSHQAHRLAPHLPFEFLILGKSPQLHALIYQWDTMQKDSANHRMGLSVTPPGENHHHLAGADGSIDYQGKSPPPYPRWV